MKKFSDFIVSNSIEFNDLKSLTYDFSDPDQWFDSITDTVRLISRSITIAPTVIVNGKPAFQVKDITARVICETMIYSYQSLLFEVWRYAAESSKFVRTINIKHTSWSQLRSAILQIVGNDKQILHNLKHVISNMKAAAGSSDILAAIRQHHETQFKNQLKAFLRQLIERHKISIERSSDIVSNTLKEIIMESVIDS